MFDKELKYKSFKEWKKSEPKAYSVAKTKGLLLKISELTGWILPNPNKFFYTKEDCYTEALKYKTLKSWQRKSVKSFNIATKNGWLDDCSKHMVEFDRNPMGYWTKEKCLEEALKYKTKSEWGSKSQTSYSVAHRKNWIEEFSSHMLKKNENGYWTKERCLQRASNFSKIYDWRKNDYNSYIASHKHGFYYECCLIFNIKRKSRKGRKGSKWTLEKCLEEALKYTSKKDWRENNFVSYNNAKKNNWVNICTENYPAKFYKTKNKPIKLKKIVTLDDCLVSALKYKSKSEWRKKDSKNYLVAKKNNWLDKCSKHMEQPTSLFWTLEKCKEEALKYTSKTSWRKNSRGSYNSAESNKWFKECCGHMTPSIYWKH